MKKPHFSVSTTEDRFSDALISLRTSIDERNPQLGSCLHAKTIKLGLENDVFVANSILDVYAKCCQIEDAIMVFDKMPYRTVVSWTSMISAYCLIGLADEAVSIFLHMLDMLQQPNEYTLAVLLRACSQNGDWRLVESVHSCAIKNGFLRNDFLQNSLLDAYVKCGMIEAAEKLLERWVFRDVISWTSVISGCVAIGMVEKAVALFFRMQEDDVLPNEVTILSILRACSDWKNSGMFQWVHGMILKAGWYKNESILNSLVEMYSTNGYYYEGARLFCDFCFTGEGLYLHQETVANLIHGCQQFSSFRVGASIHGYLLKNGFLVLPCTIIENSLIYMYGENAENHLAFQLFTRMANKDIISWNTMMGCCVKNEEPIKALALLYEIHHDGAQDNVFPDFITMITSLQACSELASLLQQGQIIHCYTTKKGFLHDIFIQNSLIDMYAKSGQLHFAESIFKEMEERDLGSWNSLIAAHSIHGNGDTVLKIFSELRRSKTLNLNGITFTNVLSACAHAGKVEEGLEIFKYMKTEYGLEPSEKHFTCIVDLLGRSGRIEEAETLIEKMPLMPGPDVWGALLAASVLYNNIKIGEKAAKELATLEPDSSVWRITLSNLYAKAGRWRDVAKVREEMRGSEKLKKEGGWSILNRKGTAFRFMAGDTRHPKSGMIYEVVNGLHRHMTVPRIALELVNT